MAAYQLGDREYFVISDEEMRSLGGKLIVQLLSHGYSRTISTHDFAGELRSMPVSPLCSGVLSERSPRASGNRRAR